MVSILSLIDIDKSIVKILEVKGMEIYGQEVKENFKTPCFFINYFIDKCQKECYLNKNSVFVEITFYDDKGTQLSYMEMCDFLRNTFTNPIQIGDRIILPLNISSDFEKDFLSFKFYLKFYDEIKNNINKNKYKNMEILDLNINKRKDDA